LGVGYEACLPGRHGRTLVNVVWLRDVRVFRFGDLERGVKDQFFKGLELSLLGLEGWLKERK